MKIKKIIYNLIIDLIYLILLFIGKTSKKIYLNYEIRANLEQKNIPIIYSFWHNRLLYLAFLYRKTYFGVMVSQHKDGNYIADIMKKCRLYPVRGSSTRGGIRALLEIINYLKQTKIGIAFSPDGPKGPKYQIQEGILLAALKTGSPIVPLCWSAKKKKIFNSWDNFIFPFPFNKFVIVYGTPLYIKSKTEMEKAKEKLQKEMMRIVEIADNYSF